MGFARYRVGCLWQWVGAPPLLLGGDFMCTASCTNRSVPTDPAVRVAPAVGGGTRASEVKQPGRVAPLDRGAGLVGHAGRPDPLLLEDGVKDRSARGVQHPLGTEVAGQPLDEVLAVCAVGHDQE